MQARRRLIPGCGRHGVRGFSRSLDAIAPEFETLTPIDALVRELTASIVRDVPSVLPATGRVTSGQAVARPWGMG
jgi:hypothetical protein